MSERLIVSGFIVGGIVGIVTVIGAPITIGTALIVDSIYDISEIVDEIKK